MSKNLDFETSGDLKKLFNQELDAWSSRHRLGIEELSARCGVSRSYLAHIGRYGRIPSKPVLILLALNFEMKDPAALLRAAKITEPWPFDVASAIQSAEKKDPGFLSVKLDMDGFVDAIRLVVRDHLRPRSLKDLLGDRPLRVGLNLSQPWMYQTDEHGAPDPSRGLIPEFIGLLRNALGCAVSTLPVQASKHIEKLSSGEIDLFGPMLTIPPGPSKTFFSLPVNRVGVSAIMRVRETPQLASVPAPKYFEELRDPAYQVAVIKGTRAHLLANTRLNRTNENLILCDSDDEALDRVMLRGVAKPAHIFICNSMCASKWASDHPEAVQAVFNSRLTMIEICDSAFAIRPDWPEAVPMINQAISFIMNSGGFAKRAHDVSMQHQLGVFDVPDYGSSTMHGFLGMVG